MNDVAVVFAIVLGVVVLFVWNRIPAVLVALGTPLALHLTGILGASEAMAGFGDQIVIFLASLFVVSAGLEAAGVTTWVGQLLIAKAGTSRVRLLVLIMLLAGLTSALIGFIGTVAALLPVVVVIDVRLRIPASQLLMPLAFSASAGGLLTLPGSPVNLITANAAEETGVGMFGYLEFAVAGLPTLLGVMVIVLLFGHRLLTERSGSSLPADLSAHTQTLDRHDQDRCGGPDGGGTAQRGRRRGPRGLLGGLFLLTAILGQRISNTATALIIVPMAVAAATDIGISARPVLMSITVAAAASFLTPVATPPNLMVMGPGGYRFGDYWKLGWPCMVWFFVVSVLLVPLYWSF